LVAQGRKREGGDNLYGVKEPWEDCQMDGRSGNASKQFQFSMRLGKNEGGDKSSKKKKNKKDKNNATLPDKKEGMRTTKERLFALIKPPKESSLVSYDRM